MDNSYTKTAKDILAWATSNSGSEELEKLRAENEALKAENEKLRKKVFHYETQERRRRVFGWGP